MGKIADARARNQFLRTLIVGQVVWVYASRMYFKAVIAGIDAQRIIVNRYIGDGGGFIPETYYRKNGLRWGMTSSHAYKIVPAPEE
jgi:hypothetical protein